MRTRLGIAAPAMFVLLALGVSSVGGQSVAPLLPPPQGRFPAPAVPPSASLLLAEPLQELRDVYVVERGARGVSCRPATPSESLGIRDRSVPLHFIKGGDAEPKAARTTGLTIQLRGTAQLENYPQAKAAFIRAAQRWESVLHDAVTIIIDVDFGTTAFGTPYPKPNILGITSADTRTGSYVTFRTRLLSKYPSFDLYQKLPTVSAPTDHGSASTVVATSASLRSIGLLPATQASTDAAPAIAFNSAHGFDFVPEDGIDPGTSDFDSTATHEMGHVLGFISMVGDLELHPTDAVMLSNWDLFRFRPGVTTAAFTTTQRILSSGGDQIFFDSSDEVPLSTARPDQTGGDGNQASHWKDDQILHSYIGIMDPTLPSGFHEYMTGWDLLALAFMGWSLDASSFNQAFITSVTPSQFNPGDPAATLTIAGTGFASGASVLWKGSPRFTTSGSATGLTAEITAADLAAPGVASVEVVNTGAIPSNTFYVSIGAPATTCVASATTLCLADGRFGVTATWQKPGGDSGSGTAVLLTGDTGYFWFFDPTNVEVITKVLNGCPIDNSYWVFSSGLTNVGVTLTYTDYGTNRTKVYTNTVNAAFAPIQDTKAFATCP